jgi:hypothetical protein
VRDRVSARGSIQAAMEGVMEGVVAFVWLVWRLHRRASGKCTTLGTFTLSCCGRCSFPIQNRQQLLDHLETS